LDNLPLGLWFWVALIVLLLGLQALFTASEIGIFATGVVRARRRADEGSRAAALIVRLLKDRSRLLTTILVAITAILYVVETIATWAGDKLNPRYGHVIAFVAITAVVIVFTEVTPVAIASKRPERTALFTAPLVALANIVLWPVVAALSGISRGVLRLFGVSRDGRPTVTEAEFLSMIDDAAVAEHEKRMLRSVFDFGDRTVSEVMVPRTDMVCIEESKTLREALELHVKSGFTRLPVYREHVDNIVGINYSKDLLPFISANKLDAPVSAAMREPYCVPESKKLDELLPEMQVQHRLMAIVVDEFGGTAGLVTMEDILEEIVGEIFDEYDRPAEEPLVRREGAGSYVILGRAPLHQLNRELGLSLPEEQSETLGGLVSELLGAIPTGGERVTYEDRLRFEVLEVDGNRVHKVRVSKLAEKTGASENES